MSGGIRVVFECTSIGEDDLRVWRPGRAGMAGG
jgi:hypothetical protein